MSATGSRGAAETLLIAAGLLTVDLLLVIAHLRERSRREAPLDDADRKYFANRDKRRWTGSVLMAVAAILMMATARIEPRGDLAASRLYVLLWLGVLTLVAGLLALALSDWVANRRYAARHRRQLIAERDRLVAEAAREARQRRQRRRSPGGDPSWN
ncbi:MAG: hypothetical protein KatS3mg108_1301 [Isosphaeraceae bacterium]|nr:MAG: hypothetical protein KatS3mg108_1301 [Isosphaeraceae bacterium]